MFSGSHCISCEYSTISSTTKERFLTNVVKPIDFVQTPRMSRKRKQINIFVHYLSVVFTPEEVKQHLII